MFTRSERPSIDIFTPWEKELCVEIMGHEKTQSSPSKGDTLFDHIIEAYLGTTKSTIGGNLDTLIERIEVREFQPDKKYLKVKIKENIIRWPRFLTGRRDKPAK
jgi:hypothetical protein